MPQHSIVEQSSQGLLFRLQVTKFIQHGHAPSNPAEPTYRTLNAPFRIVLESGVMTYSHPPVTCYIE